MRDLITRAGGEHVLPAALYRKNDHARANAKMDPYALKAWCWEVLARANATTLPAAYRPGTIDIEFLRKVARLSWSEEGPRLAREFLAKHGIHLIYVEHLPRTHLDGAALQLADGTPVIGLTLRYDRLDNFWFCLLHELSHIGRHMDGKRDEAFIDDLSLRDVEGVRRDSKEDEADEWAEAALIPKAVWETSRVGGQSVATRGGRACTTAGNSSGDCRGTCTPRNGEFSLAFAFRGNGRGAPATRQRDDR
jgi:HTH-type transcriptional regulator/antitoxin HigA